MNCVESNRTFGEGDDGDLQIVISEACLTIPNDDTYKFQKLDRLYVHKQTTFDVTIVGEQGVTIHATGSKIQKNNAGALYVKVGPNEWVEMTGNLI